LKGFLLVSLQDLRKKPSRPRRSGAGLAAGLGLSREREASLQLSQPGAGRYRGGRKGQPPDPCCSPKTRLEIYFLPAKSARRRRGQPAPAGSGRAAGDGIHLCQAPLL